MGIRIQVTFVLSQDSNQNAASYNFKNIKFEMHFLREQFWSAPVFWNIVFEGVIILIFDLWLLISVVTTVVAAVCFLLMFSPQAKIFQFWHV